jgi:Tfp pilus assembly PilM family ATPase
LAAIFYILVRPRQLGNSFAASREENYRKFQDIDMFRFSKYRTSTIGLFIGDDIVKVAQLRQNGGDLILAAGGSESRPDYIQPGSSNWQRWAIEAIRKVTDESKFYGKDAVATIPAGEVFIDYIKISKQDINTDGNPNNSVMSKIKQKLPFEPDNAVIKYIPSEKDMAVVIATDRRKIDIHLAIYERSRLSVKSIAVWPLALANCYAKFFGRRNIDLESVVMLVEPEAKNTNVVISRHRNLLFARSLPLGTEQLDSEQPANRLALELNACRRYFHSTYGNLQIDRLIFFSDNGAHKDTCARIAKQLELPAQMGDCLAAIRIDNPCNCKIERRGCKESWATTFGLSLS